MTFDITGQAGQASTEFRKFGRDVENLQDKLRQLDRTVAEPTVRLDTKPASREAGRLAAELKTTLQRAIRDLPAVDLDTIRAQARIAALKARLEALRAPSLRVDVDVAAAVTDVAAVRAALDGVRDTRVTLDVATGGAATEVAAIAAALRELSDGQVRVDVDTGDAQRGVAALHASLLELRALSPLRLTVDLDDQVTAQLAAIRAAAGGLAGHIRITVEVDAGNSAAELIALAALLEALDGTTRHRVEVDAAGAAVSAAAAGVKILALGAALLYTIPLAGQATAAAVTLGGSLVALSGVAGLLPGTLTAGAVAAGALAVGLAHVGDALGETDTPAKLKKVNEAITALSPSARAAVVEIRGLGPAITGLRLDVQERLFKGVSTEVDALAGTYIPVLRTGLGGISDEFNLLGKDVSGFARSADTVRDVETIFTNTERAMVAARPAATNLLAAWTDMSVVGSEMLPELADGWTSTTGRFREFIAESRSSGELKAWIQGGIDTLVQLGDIAGNTGSILASTFRAARESGADFLGTIDRITVGVAEFLRSTEGNNTLVAFFTESRTAVDAALPGLDTAARSGAAAVAAFSDTQGLTRFGEAFSVIAEEAGPVVPMLGELAGGVLGALADGATVAATALGPVVDGAVGIVGALGPVAPLVIASVVAFKTFGLATAAVVGLGTAVAGTAALLSTYTAALTGSLAAGALAQRAAAGLGAALTAFGRALPLVGVAVVGLGVLLDGAVVNLDEGTAALARGGQAADDMTAAVDDQLTGFGKWLNSMVGFASTSEDMRAELDKQRGAMSAVELAQADVIIAQGEWTQAIADFGRDSPQAAAAADALAAATDRVQDAQRTAADATQTHTDRMLEQQQAAYAATNADLAYLDSLDRITEAQDRAAEAARNHGAGSRELEQANRDVLRANLDAAAAAGAKAEADARATGASNAAEIGARAQKDELIRLAQQASGPTRQALLDMAAGTDLAARSSSTAEIQSRLQKDELTRLASTADGPLRAAMLAAGDTFGTLGGAHATAQQRAQAQKDELGRLAAMASGPLRVELERMYQQLLAAPDANFNVTATGTLGPITNSSISQADQRDPRTARATGGILPGYTPGRDVHQFTSPTGGRLELSGGEAVMRPEWTRAVGSRWVDGANRAARMGGVRAVADYLVRTSPRPAGREGVAGDGNTWALGGIIPAPAGPFRRYAFGGLIRAGVQPFQELSNRDYLRSRDAMVTELAARMRAQIKAAQAAAAAAAAGGGSASGPITAGAAAGLNWARTQNGKPYGWGMVGPGSYDCSGFMSAILNVMRGRGPHSRVGSTGTFPWAGFRSGIGPGLNIGAFKGSPGHMAGTIGGTNVESSGSAGVRVGGGARGAGHSMFTTRAHIADQGAVLRHRELAVNLSGRPERVLSPDQTRVWDRAADTAAGRGPGLTAQRPAGDTVAALRTLAGEISRSTHATTAGGGAGGAPAVSVAGVEDRLDRLTRTLERRGAAATINMPYQGPDPAEAARSVVLALRLA